MTNDPASIYIARQPIFNRKLEVYGYEVLYRAADTGNAGFQDGNAATSDVLLNAFLNIGFADLTGGKRVFVNLTRDFLTGKIPIPIQQQQLVLEILEDIDIDAETIGAVNQLANRGYSLALDDYTFTHDKIPIFDLVDIIKIDLMAVSQDQLREGVDILKRYKVKLLAEKVETLAEYELCHQLGFDYFQGYFFSKPKLVGSKSVPANRRTLVSVLAKLYSPNCEFRELEALISHDVGLSYKVLRILNSAHYGLPVKVNSIHHALVILGMNTLRDWFSIMMLSKIQDKPRELISLSLARAHMCKQLAELVSDANPNICFTVGMFSTVDAFLDTPMNEVTEKLPFQQETTDALVLHQGIAGKILDTVLACERGQWEDAPALGIKQEDMQHAYNGSIVWADETMKHI